MANSAAWKSEIGRRDCAAGVNCSYAPLVSVVMPTYHRGDTLKRAIASVLGQTYRNLELIVVNDNGDDGRFTPIVREIVASFVKSDGRLRLLEPSVHKNGAFARNRGVEASSGELLAFLDDDDWWEPEKIELQVNAFSKLSDEWGVVSCRVKRYCGNKLLSVLPKHHDGHVYKDVMLIVSDFPTGTLMIRRPLFEEVGGFDESLVRHQDIQLLIELTYRKKLLQLDELLHCCDVTDGQNRLGPDDLVKAKRALFESVADVYGSLKSSEKRAVVAAQSAEVGRMRIKEGEKLKGIVDILGLLAAPEALVKTVEKALLRARGNRKARKVGDAS